MGKIYVCVAVLFLSLCAFAKADPLLTADESKKCQAVVDALLKAGFPDGKGATVYVGKIQVSATYDPTKDAPPLPSDASNTQMTSDTALVTYGYEFEGMHLQLADGSWLIAMQFHFTPGKKDKVDTTNAKQIDLGMLSADADANPFDAEGNAGKWLDAEEPARRKLAAAVMARYVPVSKALMLGSDSIAPAAIVLSRAGWPDALDLSLVAADQRARKYWQMRPWEPVAFSFDPSGEYPDSKKIEQDWIEAHPTYPVEAPDVALRRAMFRWCRGELMVLSPEDGMLSEKVAHAASNAMVDPGDPQHNLPNIDLIAESNKLVVTPDDKATLVERLQSWEARPRMPKMVVTGGNNGGLNPMMSTSFNAPKPTYEPKSADLDELVNLLADDHPSRFRDFAGGHTLGDNAWRALAVLLKDDPRNLANYPTDHPWTTKERHAASAAVADWWKLHRTEYVDK